MRAALPFLVVACGGSSNAPPAASPVPSLVAVREGPTDLQVATVNGRPVWGSCVARQGNLDDCIAFELLAQAAEAKGLATDPGVREAAKTALVNRLVGLEFEDKVKTVADLKGAYDPLIEKNLFRMHRPEVRASAYVRAVVPPHAAPEVEAKAHATIEAIAAALRDETGLFPEHMFAIADRVAPGVSLEKEPTIKPMLAAALETPYGSALYAIPEVGRTSGPVRTNEGWDVVLWTGGITKQELTRDELLGQLFPELRRHFFLDWELAIEKSLGVTVVKDYPQLEDTGS